MPAAPSSGKNADHQETVEKQSTSRVVPQNVGEDELATPRLPTTYAEKIKRITTHKLAAKIGIQDPRLVKQKSLESIQLTRPRPPTTGSQDTLQLISFDRSARTVSPSNLRPTAPTPFPSMARQDDPEDAAKQQQQRESRKRQLEADDTTATQPARPKMQPPAIPTIITTPPSTENITQPQGPARRKRRGGKGKGKRKTEAVTDAAETAPTTASTKTSAPAEVITQRASKRPRSTGAEPRIITEPPEVPVVAASTQRTKAKPATSETAPMTTEQTTANIIEDVLSLLKSAFVSVMTGESLTAVISRGLMELHTVLYVLDFVSGRHTVLYVLDFVSGRHTVLYVLDFVSGRHTVLYVLDFVSGRHTVLYVLDFVSGRHTVLYVLDFVSGRHTVL
ncbi:hypothetical protein ACJJTC_019792 [Scirpophaga incertulas]